MVTIEKARVEDVVGMTEVFYETWLDTYPNVEVGITRADIEEMFKERLTKEYIAKREAEIRRSEPGRLYLVAKEGGTVVGVCRVYVRDAYNQIQSIYVRPESQGMGVGKMFWKECVKFFDSEKDTIVEVATYNTKAIRFYESLGFVDSCKRMSDERFRMPVTKSLIPEMEMVLRVVLQKSLPK